MMERLTDDLLVEILCRLPIRSILRSSCVSKAWNRLISYSRHHHHHRHKKLPNPMAGLFYHHYIPHGIVFAETCRSSGGGTDLSFLPPHESLEIFSLCNGLLLYFTRQSEAQSYYAVCNPATAKWARLPEAEADITPIALGFDPRLSLHCTVLAQARQEKRKLMILQSGDSSSCGWKDVDLENQELEAFDSSFLSGVFYILNIAPSVHNLLAVDRRGKVFCRIELPYCVTDPLTQLLGVSDKLVHYAVKSFDELLVWTLEDCHTSKWLPKHRVSYVALLEILEKLPDEEFRRYKNKPYKLGVELVLQAFHPDMDVIYLTLRRQRVLLGYHMKSAELEVICTLEGKHQTTFFPYSPCYLEDLDLP